MQAQIRFRQARPRLHPIQQIRQGARQLGAIAGELLALTSLVMALATGLVTLTGLTV